MRHLQRRARVRGAATLAAVLTAGALGACSSGSSGPPPAASTPASAPASAPVSPRAAWSGPVAPPAYGPAAAGPAGTRYAGPGPFAVGTAVVDVAGPGRVQLWWPVDPAAARGRPLFAYRFSDWVSASLRVRIPAGLDRRTRAAVAGAPVSTAGRFAVVMFSHGFGSIPTQSTFLTEHLASWGYVVAAPDHRMRDTDAVIAPEPNAHPPQPVDDLERTLAWLREQDRTPGTLLAGRLDLAHVGVAGHSAGGHDAVALAVQDPAVAPVIALAGVPADVPAARPVLLVAGSADGVVSPDVIRPFYDRLAAPKWLVVVDGAGHNAFDDFCPDARGGFDLGGLPLPRFVADAARSGCQPTNTAPRRVWPLVDHASVALLRWTFGTDHQPVGLDAGVVRAAGLGGQVLQQQR